MGLLLSPGFIPGPYQNWEGIKPSEGFYVFMSNKEILFPNKL